MYEEVFLFFSSFFLQVNEPQKARICISGLFNYLDECTGRKILLENGGGGDVKRSGICF